MKTARPLAIALILIVIGSLSSNAEVLDLKIRTAESHLSDPRQLTVSGEEIFVLDMGDKKLKIFSLAGKYKMFLGGRGMGPGEFHRPTSFQLVENHILVYDKPALKMHFFLKKEKKFVEFRRANFGRTYTLDNPGFFITTPSGNYIFWKVALFEGDTLLIKTGKNFKPQLEFLEAIPAFKNMEQLDKSIGTEDEIKLYYPDGFMAAGKGKIYFAYVLFNKVVELSEENGKLLNTYDLPLESIDKTAKLFRFGQGGSDLETKLVYGLKVRQETLYVLARKKDGSSVIYRLTGRKFSEFVTMKEALCDFDIYNGKVYGIEDDEYALLIYDLGR